MDYELCVQDLVETASCKIWLIKYLATEQIDQMCEDDYQNTPLHRAYRYGCQAVVEFLTSELMKYTPITELVSTMKNKWNSMHTSSEWSST